MKITDYINPDNGSLKVVEEDTSTGITYIGYTELGDDTTQPIRRIKRVAKVVVGTTTTTNISYARDTSGIQLFNAIRDNRSAYNY